VNLVIKKSAFLIIFSAFLISSPLITKAGTPSCPNCDCDGDTIVEPSGDDLVCFYNLVLSTPFSPTPEQLCVGDFGGPGGVPDGQINGLDIQAWINGCTAACPGGCDDSNPCTNDACNAGSCAHTPVANGTSCVDSTVCNGAETCQAGTCTAGTPLNCDDSIACTIDACDSVNGCTHTPDDNLCADDGIACTNEVCSSMFGCASQPINSLCNDGMPCTQDVCTVGVGCSNPTINCGPNQICHPDSGQCVPENICGNGILDGGEVCEIGHSCAGGGEVCVDCQCIQPAVCGDGQVTGEEACDTNGDVGCDYADYVCQQVCLGDCSACDPEGQPSCCGDGVPDDGEDCDNGSFCENGDLCFYQIECAGIGDGQCVYRSEFATECAQDCTLIENFVLADFNSVPASNNQIRAKKLENYTIKTEGQCDYSYDREDDALRDRTGSSVAIRYYGESKKKPACKFTVTMSPRMIESISSKPNVVYRTLQFYLKGDRAKPYPATLKVEWKNTTYVAYRVSAKKISYMWQLYSIPLESTLNARGASEITEFSLIFDRNSASETSMVKFDHLSLSPKASPIFPQCKGKACLNSQTVPFSQSESELAE